MNRTNRLAWRPGASRRWTIASCRPAAMEPLEDRRLMAANPSTTEFRSLDGTGNSLANAEWGSTGEQFARAAPAAYADGASAPAGATRPSARAVSNAVSAALAEGTLNSRDLSAFIYVWGQFLDHDLDLTNTQTGAAAEKLNIAVPTGDEFFDPAGAGTRVIPLTRSHYDPATGTSAANPRQQVNSITAWIDGSMVYGSDAETAAALRTFAGGRLKASAGGLLPFDPTGLPATGSVPTGQPFLAGDIRANENIELTSMHALFVREHNRQAGIIAARNPGLGDEAIYQQARRIVGAEIQAITYNEFLPALLGPGAIDPYRGYKPTVNPAVANEFATAAYRLGHSMLGDDVEFLDANGNEVRDELALKDAFFNPAVVRETGLEPILKYLASDRAQEIDTQVVDGVRNFLFGQPGAGGFDLASLNIQRGRDHGLADYNTTRAAYGLPRVTSFSQITSDASLASKLQALYGSVNNVDLWVGGLAEDHVRGGSVGRTFTTILADQFERTRDADRFWYQNQLTGGDLSNIQRTRLADLIRRNTTLSNVQENVFFFSVTVTGTVYSDPNRTGRQDRGEAGLSGWTVELVDDTGAVVDATKTSSTGRYTFASLDLGTYSVRITSPSGWVRTSGGLDEIDITRGTTVSGVDAGFASSTPTGGGQSGGGGRSQPGRGGR